MLAALEKEMWLIAVLILISSLLAVIYIWRVVEVAYFRAPPKRASVISEPPLSMLIPLFILTGASIYFGIDAGRTVDIAMAAAKFLMIGVAQ